MRLTTLGTGTIALTVERARAGYLVEADDVRLLLDCGSGVVQRLAAYDWWGITHVALTHADETARPGAPLELALHARRPLSYGCSREGASPADAVALAQQLLP